MGWDIQMKSFFAGDSAMAVDDLLIQGIVKSAAIEVFLFSRNIPVSEPEKLEWSQSNSNPKISVLSNEL